VIESGQVAMPEWAAARQAAAASEWEQNPDLAVEFEESLEQHLRQGGLPA
jgi:hypothetical protein